MNQQVEICSLISDHEFESITRIAISEAGLSIPISKKALVQSRVTRRMRSLGLLSIEEYLKKVQNHHEEKRELVSILTTNVSSFFREHHHFEHLRETVIPTMQRKIDGGERIRIWSAGCSSGQEPYTIGMEISRSLSLRSSSDVLILATDIDPKILRKATAAEYSESDIQQVPEDERSRFFESTGGNFLVKDELKKLVRFKELNLHAEWPMSGPFDAIFCRNVLIYFDDAHQKALWPRFRELLVPDGLLYLGHSERIHPLEGSGFSSRGATIYQKTR